MQPQQGIANLRLDAILNLEVFRRAGATVVAGKDSLDRQVRWVHISDLPNAANALHGGELLLTHGLTLVNDSRLQTRYVQELSAIGVAGVALELGRAFKEVPDAMVREAQRQRLPLIVLNQILFVTVTEQVHAAILNHRYAALQQADEIGQQLMQLAALGIGIKRLLQRIAMILENPVVLEDAAHQLVDFAAHGISIMDVLALWDAHSRMGHTDDSRSSPADCLVQPITVRGEIVGRMHVLAINHKFGQLDRLAVERAGAAVTVSLIEQGTAEDLRGHGGGSLIDDILDGSCVMGEEILQRAASIGVNLSGLRLGAVAFGLTGDFPSQADKSLNRGVRRDIVRLKAEIQMAARRAGLILIPKAQGDSIVALVGLPASADQNSAVADAFIKAPIGSGDNSIRCGVSCFSGADDLRRAFRQAEEALRYARMQADTPVVYFDRLGINRLLLKLAEGPELAQFIEDELQPLLQHDARRRAQLLPILKAFLDCGGNKAVTARLLHVGRRSLYYQLDRITSVLKKNIDDAEVQTELRFAVLALELLRTKSTPGLTAAVKSDEKQHPRR
ncbi:MAG: PucR family transcriptional regulator [Candidatus Dormibacteraceae bacterium]